MADIEVRTAFANNFASKFEELPTSTEDIETEWCLLRTAVITSATNCCGRKRVGGTKSREKRTAWWNQEVKEATRAKKVTHKAWLASKSSVELRSQCSEARKVAATKVKLPKEGLEGIWRKVRPWFFNGSNIAHQGAILAFRVGMCFKENYLNSPSKEYSRHYSAESESEYVRRQNMNSKLGEEQKNGHHVRRSPNFDSNSETKKRSK